MILEALLLRLVQDNPDHTAYYYTALYHPAKPISSILTLEPEVAGVLLRLAALRQLLVSDTLPKTYQINGDYRGPPVVVEIPVADVLRLREWLRANAPLDILALVPEVSP